MKFVKSAGFTLLETLVVISLIGIILGFISLSPNLLNMDSRLEQEQQRLYHLLNLLSDRAILENQPYAILLTSQHYQFFRYEPISASWSALTADKALYNRELAAHFSWQLQQNGHAVPTDSKLPNVIFFPDGQHTPFSAQLKPTLGNLNSEFWLKGDGIALRMQP